VTKEQLLGEVEDVLRTMPPRGTIHLVDQPDNLAWMGRAAAVIDQWSPGYGFSAQTCLRGIRSQRAHSIFEGVAELLSLLHQARYDLRMQTVGPTNIAFDSGRTFDYFDGVRQIIEMARTEVFFADQYLDAEFVSRYLPHIASGVNMRLLAGNKKLATLLPAVDSWVAQSQMSIQVRSANDFHDRWVFVDRGSCYQSGASFKDGAKKAPTTLTQVTDGFKPMWDTYDRIWNRAKVER
jgi:hypothetical protein